MVFFLFVNFSGYPFRHTQSQKPPFLSPTVDKNSHASRSHFGDFLLDAIRSSKTVAAIKGIKVTFIPKEVVDVREELNCRGKVVSHIVTMKDGGEGGGGGRGGGGCG